MNRFAYFTTGLGSWGFGVKLEIWKWGIDIDGIVGPLNFYVGISKPLLSEYED